MGGIGTVKLQVEGVFSPGTTTYDPKDYYTPGNEDPAVSTADYYHMQSLQYLRPYDLSAMGTPGATARTAATTYGLYQNRYVWVMAADHPTGGDGLHRDSSGFKIGFSDDPGVLPSVVVDILPNNNQFAGNSSTIPGTTTGHDYFSDFAPSQLVYNPDDASYPFYLYTQGQSQAERFGTQSVLWKSPNLFDWTPGAKCPSNLDDASYVPQDGLTSHQKVDRLGTGNWAAYGTVGRIGRMGEGTSLGTNGKDLEFPSSLYNFASYPSVTLSLSGTALTSSSSFFSPADAGKAVCIVWNGGNNTLIAEGGPGLGFSTEAVRIETYNSATSVTLNHNNAGATLSSQTLPFEIGACAVRACPGKIGSSFYRSNFYPSQIGPTVTISGQDYELTTEDARHPLHAEDDGMHYTLAPIDASRNISQVVATIRLASYAAIYPGPTYPIGAVGIHEDGILHVYGQLGFNGANSTQNLPHVGGLGTGSLSGGTLTLSAMAGLVTIGAVVSYAPGANYVYIGQVLAFGTGVGGTGTYTIENTGSVSLSAGTTIYINGGVDYIAGGSADIGALRQQFIDYYTIATDSTTASRAAPFGVTASCSNNVVTISWMTNTLGSGAETQAYNVYKGSTSGTQSTALSGNPYSGASATDSPTPGQQWWYKVVKVSNGTEYGNRVVHVYVG